MAKRPNSRFFAFQKALFLLFFLLPALAFSQSENCSNGIDDDGDGLIDCYDSECECSGPCETFFYQTCQIPCTYHPPCDSISLGIQWESTVNTGNFPVMVAGDMDADGIPDIVVPESDGYKMYILDGKTGAAKVTITLTDFIAGGSAPCIGDTDGDGFGEIFVVSNDQTLWCFEHDGTLKFKNPAPVGYGGNYRTPTLALADFDANGQAELLIGNQIYSTANGQLLASGGAGLSKAEHPARPYFSFCSSVAMDVLPDAFCPDCDGLEIVAGNQVLSVNLVTGTIQKITEAAAPYTDGYTSVADFDQDGDLDAIVQGRKGAWNCVYVWEMETAQVIRSFNLYNNHFDGASRVNVANFDSDPALEISFVGAPRLYCLDNNFSVKWTKSINDPSSVTCSSVFDFCGDGSADIVYRSVDKLAVYEGATGTIKWQDACVSSTHIENPLILDVDADGATEIVTTCGNSGGGGRVVVYEALNTPGISSRKVWNQHGYFVTNVNDDLTIPRVQQNPNLVGNGLILNTFMNQFFDYRFAAPNAMIVLKKLECDRDSLDLEVEICNDGHKDLPPNAPIAFYKKNPQQSASSLFLETKSLGAELKKGQCRTLNFRIAAIYNDSIFAIVNDDGSLPRPFSLMDDFPSTTVGECHFGDNMVGFFKKLTPPDLDLGPDTTVCDNAKVLFSLQKEDVKSFEWQDGSALEKFTAPDAGLFWAKTVDICGFEQTDTIQVFIDSSTVVRLGQDREICLGDTLQIGAAGFDFYAWKPSAWASCQNCPKAIFRPNVSGKIAVEAAFLNGCWSRDTISVVVRDTFFKTIDTTICYGKKMFFNGSEVPTDGARLFPFSSQFGCDSTIRVEVKGTTVGTFNLTLDSAVCLGNSLIINGLQIPPNDFRVFKLKTFEGCDSTMTIKNVPLDTFWTEEKRTICAGETSPVFGQNVGATGNYKMTFSARNGCDSTHVVRLEVLPPIAISFSGETSCPDEATGKIEAQIIGSAPPFSFAWSSFFAQNQAVLSPVPSGNYALTVTDSNGCTGQSSGDVDAFADIIFELKSVDPSCFGEKNGQILVKAVAPLPLIWQLDQQAGFGQDTFFRDLKSGNYSVTAQDIHGCTASETAFLQEPPELLVVLPDDTLMGLGDSIRLQILATAPLDSMDFLWSPAKYFSCLDCSAPTVRPLHSVNYLLKITDENGCSATDQMLIEIDPTPEIYIPNALRLHALDAENSIFKIFCGPAVERIAWLRIYDRWGQLVAEKTNFLPSANGAIWDGKLGGRTVAAGVFTVAGEAVLVDGSRVLIKKDLTVLR